MARRGERVLRHVGALSRSEPMEVRYTELASELVKLITEGSLQVGDQLPSEVALAEEHQVSRTTIRSALNIVEGLGLISRRRRRGTVVVSKETRNSYTKSLHNIEDLVNYASYTERSIVDISDVVADEQLAAALECRPGQKWLKVRMLRVEKREGKAPVCWTDAYLDPEEGHPIVGQIQDGSGLLCTLIERNSGRAVIDVRQQIGATLLREEIAPYLRAIPGSAALEITRQYLDQAKKMFLITISTYPADTFKFTFSLHRAKATEL